MEKLRPQILTKFKNNKIDIFKITEEEREKYITQFENEINNDKKEKMMIRNKLYYEKNKEKINQTNKEKYKQYYNNNKEKVINRVKTYQKLKKELKKNDI
jgi:esterase/lipase